MSCKSCKHSRTASNMMQQLPEGHVICAAHPPQAFAVPIMMRNRLNPADVQQQIAFQTAPPTPPDDFECGEYAPRESQLEMN